MFKMKVLVPVMSLQRIIQSEFPLIVSLLISFTVLDQDDSRSCSRSH